MLKPNFLLTKKIPLTVVRRIAGSYVDGEWVEGTTTELPIECNIQPIKPYELMMFPESERSKVWMRLYTGETLRTQREGTGGYDADEFTWKGDRFKIMKVNDWNGGMGILEHTECFAVRIELTPN